jgi:hypothetical protein
MTARGTDATPRGTDPPGVIAAHEAYTLAEFSRRNRLGTWALREARRDGLIVRRVGGRAYILGADWLAYLARQRPET